MKKKVKLSLQLLVALAVLTSIYFLLKPYRASHYLRMGQELIGKKRYDEALGFLEKAVNLDPLNPRIHFHLGQIYGLKGYLEKTKAEGEKIPLSAQLYLKKSIAEFQKANRTLHDVKIQYNLGVSHELLGNYQEAFASFQKAFLYKPDYKNVVEKLSEASEKLGSQKDLEYAVQVQPNNFSAQIKLGRILFASKRFSEARKVYLNIREFCRWEKAIDYINNEDKQDQKTNFDLLVQMFLAMELGRYSESAVHLKEILEKEDLDPAKILPPPYAPQEKYKTRSVIVTSWQELIPDEFQEFLGCVTLAQAGSLLKKIGYTVYTSPQQIGNTRIKTPADIEVKSSTDRKTLLASIKIDGKEYSFNKRGFNGVIIDGETGRFKVRGHFDTYRSEEDVIKLTGFIENAEEGDIVILAVKDEGAKMLNKYAYQALRTIGGIPLLKKERIWWSYIIIGIKGAEPGTALELTSQNPLKRTILKGVNIKNPQNFLAKNKANFAIHITGMSPESSVTTLHSR